MPDEKNRDAEDITPDAGDPAAGAGPCPDEGEENGSGRKPARDGEKQRPVKPPALRHITPLTIGLLMLSVLCGIALIIVFNLESIRRPLEHRGVLWILPACLLLAYGLMVTFLIVRELSYLRRLEGVLDDVVDANKRLLLLMEAGREMGSTLDRAEILHKILDYASDVTGARMGAVYLWDKSEDVLKLAVLRGIDESKMMFRELPMKHGLLGRVASDRRIAAIDDTASIDERDNVFFGAAKPRSMAIVPLVARGKFLGMLVAANAEGHLYSGDERRLLEGLGELASLAITNAELYRIARKSLDALSRERGVTDSVLEEMVAGVMTADARGRIGVFNREAQRLTGYTFAEKTQVRLRLETSLDQNPMGPLEHGMLEVLDNPSLIREGDALVMKSDKTLLPVSYRIYPLVNGPEVIGAACVFMETKGVPSETPGKGQVDYQVLLRSLGARIERVYTHPLSRVMERMRSMDLEDWSRAREDIVRTLKAGHSTLLGLLEDLEQYLNCTTTREWDTAGECDLAAILQEVVRETVSSPEAGGVMVSVRLARLRPVFGFERMIRAALEQVMENACIAASSGEKKVEVTGENSGSFVNVEVRDYGPGLSPEAGEFMFMPFFTDWEGRSGLGLSIVKRVMGRLGGRVTFDALGDGARFTLEFPTAPGGELDDRDGESAAGAVNG